jgi:hypothetical protein
MVSRPERVTLRKRLQALLDKDAIRDCLMRYSRGMDRQDWETARSAYWTDAIDDHILYVGGPEGLFEHSASFLVGMRTQHLLGNVLIELEDDRMARSETYYVATHDMPTAVGRQDFIMKGRYIDRFQKRGEEWRILHRTLTCDLYSVAASTADWNSPVFKDLRTRGEAYPDDPYYRLLRRWSSEDPQSPEAR